MTLIPDNEKLEAIKAQGYSGSVLHKKIGPYSLSCVYRQCSAVAAPDHWYPETRIMKGEWGKDEDGRMNRWPSIEYQGEGWATFLHLANDLNTVEEVEHFLAVMNEPDND